MQFGSRVYMNISSSKGHDSVITNRLVPAEADRCLCFKANVLKYEFLVKGLGQDRNMCVGGCIYVNVCVHTYMCMCMQVHTPECVVISRKLLF